MGRLLQFLLVVLISQCMLTNVSNARVRGKNSRETEGHSLKGKYDDDQDHLDIYGNTKTSSSKETVDAHVEGKDYWNQAMQAELQDQLNKVRIEAQAKNIIFFLGDGTSISTLTGARLLKGLRSGNYEHEVMAYEKFPYSCLIKTYSFDKMVTDSAASATAYLTGTKANQATLGVDANVKLEDCEAMRIPQFHSQSILRNFQNDERSTGIVTVTRVTHASPAGTYAHTAERHWESDDDINDAGFDSDNCDDIAEQLVLGETGANIKVILGGGRQKFQPKDVEDPEGGDSGRRDDGKDLIKTWLNQKKYLGNNSYVWHRNDLLSVDTTKTEYLLGLFDYGHMEYAIDKDDSNPSLEEMTRVAIKILQKDQKGYFLFVEGGNIDRAHHVNEHRSALEEALEFEKAIAAAVEMTSEMDTLIIITADHSHPFVINGYQSRKSDVLGIAEHSDIDMLPFTTVLYATGPGYRGEVDGKRPDPSKESLTDDHYMAASAVPLESANHAGDDVILYARGPFAHLFTGIHENAYIPHALRYASCVGDGLKYCTEKRQ